MNKEKLEKLTVKDLINIGIFTALYIAIIFIAASVVFLPILQLLMPATAALLLAPVYLLFVAKTQKCFCITLMGLICSLLIGVIMYGNFICFAINMAIFILAEIVAHAGKYKSLKMNALSYIISSYCTLGEIGTIWYNPDLMYNLSIQYGYDTEFIEAFLGLATARNLVIVLISIFVCGVISVLFTRKLFKKHFVRAGIV